MAVASWMIRNRSLHSGRFRNRNQSEDLYKLDISKSPFDNTCDVYQGLCSPIASDAKRMGYLNALVAVIKSSGIPAVGFTTEELLCCLRVSVVNECTQVRAGALRAMRHILTNPEDVLIFNELQLPHLVSRCLDVVLKNEMERIQSLKLVRRVLVLNSDHFSHVLAMSLVALGMGGGEQGDRLLRACLATLCELGVLKPNLLIRTGGVGVILHNVLECHSPRIAESLIGVLLHLLENPETRFKSAIKLDMLAAPYCDFHYRLGIMDKNKDARDLRFTCSRLALLSVLRSWAGTMQFCNPDKRSGLSSIVSVLYLNQLEVRKAVLDLLYELLGLPQPAWTDEYSVALAAIDPSDFQDNWRLNEGFVAAEGRSILPSLANRVPNPAEMHLALLLYCFLESGLLVALVEVIVGSDTFISVRATILLGKLLYLMHTLLPPDICDISPALPNLISYASANNPQALAAVTVLQNLDTMMKNRPASASLFLDQILLSGNVINSKLFHVINNSEKSDNNKKKKYEEYNRLSEPFFSEVIKSNDIKEESTKLSKKKKIFKFFHSLREIEGLLRISNVLNNNDGAAWNWEIIRVILKTESPASLDDPHLRFIRRLVHYFSPSSNRFSHQDLGHSQHPSECVLAGADLVDWLCKSSHPECLELLTEWFVDIANNLTSVSASRSAHDCLFSPQHMISTMCQMYFVFIGRFCRCEKGLTMLNTTGVFGQLLHLVLTTNHSCYVKLIISSLDYSMDDFPRYLIAKATLSPIISTRLYATQFLLVLLRSAAIDFHIWGLELIVQQLRDTDITISNCAMEILSEACNEKIYLTQLILLWPELISLGDHGRLIYCQLFSMPSGLDRLNNEGKIIPEIVYWKTTYNIRYVLLVETDTHCVLTQHNRNPDGSYGQRMSSCRSTTMPNSFYLHPHLYGQLVQTEEGLKLLSEHGGLQEMLYTISQGLCTTEIEIISLKAALWAIGHGATNAHGVHLLLSQDCVLVNIIDIAQQNPVYSIRATAFYVLGLIGSTYEGANLLYKLDWLCVRHQRNEQWPIIECENWQEWWESDKSRGLNEYEIEKNNIFYDRSAIILDNNYLFEQSSVIVEPKQTEKKRGSFFFSQAGVSSNSLTTDKEISVRENRSKTLPQSSLSIKLNEHSGHYRSMSESKSSTNHMSMGLPKKMRSNSGTDSSSSGISSCDSGLGKIVISERIAPLSPIPSSTNISMNRSIAADRSERSRKISLPSNCSELGTHNKHNQLSHRDLQGYATLRSLSRHRRPFCSESNADDFVIVRKTDKHPSRSLKVRSLDRQHSVMSWKDYYWGGDFSSSYSVSGSTTTSSSPLDKKGPCYMGISLPKTLSGLFSSEDFSSIFSSLSSLESVSLKNNSINNNEFIKAIQDKRSEILNDFINEKKSNKIFNRSNSNMSDFSGNDNRPKWMTKHNGKVCILCCRSKSSNKVLRSSELLESEISTSFKKVQNGSMPSCYSTDSSVSEEITMEKVTPTILKHIQRMANPVWYKQSRQALLELKQRYPSAFQDICLYSEMCIRLSSNTYRLVARRFLQELFLDLNFDSFYEEPNEIFTRVASVRNSAITHTQDSNAETGIPLPKTSYSAKFSDNNVQEVISNKEEIPVADYNRDNSSVCAKNYTGILKSPPLAIVREMSLENLCESEGNTAHKIDEDISNKSSQRTFSFRYNTKCLDLSCTKNKFPITKRVTPTSTYYSKPIVSPSSRPQPSNSSNKCSNYLSNSKESLKDSTSCSETKNN